MARCTAALALLAIGFQVHASINADHLRDVAREDLASVRPVFWIGSDIASLPLALVVRRADGVIVIAGAGGSVRRR